MEKNIKTGILKGALSIAPYQSPLDLVSMGNASKCSYVVETEAKELMDFQNPGGGLDDEFERLKSGKISLSLRHASVANFALALGASTELVEGDDVTGEEHSAKKGMLVVFDHMQDLSQPLTVTETGGVSPYKEGVDFTRTRAGLIPTEDGDILDGAKIEVSYKSLTYTTFQPLVDLTREYRVFMDGINERSGRPVQADWYRVKFGPAKNLEFIGDDFVSLDVEGTLLKDETKTGVGLSQYQKIKVA